MLKIAFAALLSVGAVLSFASASEARSYPPLFGTKEIGSNNWKFNKGVVPEWNRMLGRWKNGAPCETSICTSKSWKGLVEQVRTAGGPMAQVKTVNMLLNKYPYIEDINNWGKSEFWATSYEFLKKSGDCEDYTIAKYMMLKEVGIPVENMRIFTVRLRNLGGLGHAILVVYQDNKAWVLDNRLPVVMDAKLVQLEYQPVMSLNEIQWWYHLPSR